MKKLLEWLMKTPCQRGRHNFIAFLLESKFPDRTMNVKNVWDFEDLKDHTYEVRCQFCGKTPQEVNNGC